MDSNAPRIEHVFAAAVLAIFLILTALGNAMAILVFSVLALIAWLAVPRFRGKVPLVRGLVAGGLSFTIAVTLAYMLS